MPLPNEIRNLFPHQTSLWFNQFWSQNHFVWKDTFWFPEGPLNKIKFHGQDYRCGAEPSVFDWFVEAEDSLNKGMFGKRVYSIQQLADGYRWRWSDLLVDFEREYDGKNKYFCNLIRILRRIQPPIQSRRSQYHPITTIFLPLWRTNTQNLTFLPAR